MTLDQLLEQGAAEYMSAGQLDFFKSLLLDKQHALRARIAFNHGLCKIERQADEADAASVEEGRNKALRMIELDQQTLNDVAKALTAIYEESYGYCVDTGEPITLQRLVLVPESLLTVDALNAREAKLRHRRVA